MNSITDLLGSAYLTKFHINHYGLLFPPEWENLKLQRCPICFNKMTIPRNGKIVICKGKKHGRAFVLTIDKYKSILK